MRHALLLLCLTLLVDPAHVKRVIDGDTFILCHVGVPAEERVRVLGVDTPERGKPGFLEARAYTTAWLAQGPSLMTTCERDSFGRYLATLERGGETLADGLHRGGW